MNFIINNCLINEKTIFEGIKYVPVSTVMSIGRHITMESYYVFSFGSYYSDDKEANTGIQNALSHGVDNLQAASDRTILAMSGGWDARAILYYLTQQDEPGIDSFSYKDAKYDLHKDTDADISARIAQIRGSKHSTIDLYQGNFPNLLENNAAVGKCISAFCYELDAFRTLQRYGYTDIVFGDHIFGYGKKNIIIRSKEDVLQQIAVYKSASVKSLRKFFADKKVYERAMAALDREVDLMYDKSNGIDNYTDRKDFLYYQQRVQNLIMPLRQMIGGMIGYVHTPFLSKGAIDACSQITTRGRIDKTQYKEALLDQFPDLFEVPYATNSGRGVDWVKEINTSKNALLEKLTNYPAELEGIFPKHVVIRLLNETSSNNIRKLVRKYKWYATAGIGYLRRRFNVIEKVLKRLFGPHYGEVDHTTILINILYIIEYLERVENRTQRKE